MAPDPMILARLLSLAGLIASTGEFAQIIRRRAARRARAAERAEFEEHGLNGLVRILLVGNSDRGERWGDRGMHVRS